MGVPRMPIGAHGSPRYRGVLPPGCVCQCHAKFRRRHDQWNGLFPLWRPVALSEQYHVLRYVELPTGHRANDDDVGRPAAAALVLV